MYIVHNSHPQPDVNNVIIYDINKGGIINFHTSSVNCITITEW